MMYINHFKADTSISVFRPPVACAMILYIQSAIIRASGKYCKQKDKISCKMVTQNSNLYLHVSMFCRSRIFSDLSLHIPFIEESDYSL